ncbi:MAG: hypothetical protein IPK59_01725 [Rhodospirillaceae bacterium]|nr:hypothetical protein [Rhodospirillaceae bacterium]
MTAAARFSSLCLALLLATILPATAQQAAQWERSKAKSVVYANLVTKNDELFGFFCRAVNNRFVGGIVVQMPSFRTLIHDEQSYSLNIVIDGARDSVTLKAKNVDLWFEASDLNQQLLLGRILDAVKASHRLELAISSINWRASYDFTDADKALDGLMKDCL